MRHAGSAQGSMGLILGLLMAALSGCAQPAGDDEVPITTASEEARAAYLTGRDLIEKLRLTDARQYALEAVAKDESFALGHLLMANTATTATDFFDSLARAVELADQASDGERDMILGLDAGARGDPEAQLQHYSNLVASYPDDERAHNLLGGYYFGRQEWEQAIGHYRKATEINPDFSQPYNQYGYALRFVDRYDEAEQAFQQYIRLIPDEPNPYDSYAELLMKTGRFEESIRSYEQALERDPDFVASYIGIANNRMFMGKPEEARETLRRLTEIARSDGERRQALFWTIVSYLHEGNHDEALRVAEERYAIAAATEDLGTMSGDLVLMGNILLDAGSYDEALAKYRESIELSERSDSPPEVKKAAGRNIFYNEARVALARGDLDTASAITNRYGDLVAQRQIPFELRRHRELVGLIALEQGDYRTAIEHLEKANQQDPRVLYEMALAYKGAGERDRAAETCDKAANWNALAINFAFIRGDARELAGEI